MARTPKTFALTDAGKVRSRAITPQKRSLNVDIVGVLSAPYRVVGIIETTALSASTRVTSMSGSLVIA